MTTTVDIETINSSGGLEPIYHAATASVKDALSIVSSHAPAPVNRWVRERLERDGGGEVQIGMVRAAISVYP